VLEPGRSLTLAEKGGGGAELVVGAAGFQVLATMNPGGDFGKKELSPALSNRFTQVRLCVSVTGVLCRLLAVGHWPARCDKGHSATGSHRCVWLCVLGKLARCGWF
jgi:hypothetical protein